MKGLITLLERYFPCPFERGGSVLVTFGVLSTLLYVYTKIWYRGEFQNLPENMMVLTFFISAWFQRHRLKSDTIFILLIFAFVIPWLLFGVNALIDYETALKYRSSNDLLKFFIFLPLAWWTGGSWVGARRMLTIAFLGLVTAVVLDPTFMNSLNMLWTGHRVDFDIHNAQHGALFFGLVLLFCLGSFRLGKNETASAWVDVRLFLACLIGVIGLLGTQTRAAFLGLIACGFVALVQGVRQRIHLGQNRLSITKGSLVLALVVGLLVWSGKEILGNRFTAEKVTIQALITGKLEAVPFGSIGIRVHSWAESLKWIAEKPVTGWGLKARSDVIKMGGLFPDDIKAQYGHLHNGYLEVLIGFGVVGFLHLAIFWVILLRRIKLAANKDLYAFALYSSVFFLVLNLFESFLFYWSGVFAISLFMSGGYSQYLARSLDGGHPDRGQSVLVGPLPN